MRLHWISALLLAGSVTFAWAADQQTIQVRRATSTPACFDDAMKFCEDVPYGKGRRLACLAKHKAQLTTACREKLPFMQAVFEMSKKQVEQSKATLAKRQAARKGPIRQVKPATKPPVK